MREFLRDVLFWLSMAVCIGLNAKGRTNNGLLLAGKKSGASEVQKKVKQSPFSLTASSGYFFIENIGQITDQHGQPRNDIQYRLAAKGIDIFIGNGQIHYQWIKKMAADSLTKARELAGRLSSSPLNANKCPVSSYRLDVQLLGANFSAKPLMAGILPYYEQYFTNKTQLGKNKAASCTKIIYPNVYANIDWVLYLKNNKLEYDFVLRPGAKVSDIQIEYKGASKIKLNNDGSCTANTPLGSITENAPEVYAASDGKMLASAFTLKGNLLGFKVDGGYNGGLVIDPVLEWGTYYGGSAEAEEGTATTCDLSGNVFLTGYSWDVTNIATTGAYQQAWAGREDVFIAKFNAAGQRQWGTYYGGAGADVARGIVSDAEGNILLAGQTDSKTAIATAGAFKTLSDGGTDGFLAKFNASGAIVWGSYYGGDANDDARSICAAPDGSVYITGYTMSIGMATQGSHNALFSGYSDAYLAKFNAAGQRQWASYYGGDNYTFGCAVATDKDGNVFFAGQTQSEQGIATANSAQPTLAGANDGFLAKFSSSGVRQWGTYFGGPGNEYPSTGTGVAVDDYGNVYFTGITYSTAGIATTNAHQTVLGGPQDGYLAKIDGAGKLIWATYYGGEQTDQSYGISCNRGGDVYMIGNTNSTTGIATAGAYKDTYAAVSYLSNAFLVKIDSAGQRVWATYYGGDRLEQGQGIHADTYGNVYFSGRTSSGTGVSTDGSHQSTGGVTSTDAFLVKFNDCPDLNPAIIQTGIQLSTGNFFSYQWLMENAPVNGANNATYTPGQTGNYAVEVKDINGCRETSDSKHVLLETNLYVPNMFSPNGDGRNDVLKVYGNLVASVEFRIYNQWGQLLFDTKDPQKGWDGTASGKLQPVGVYVYTLKGNLQNGNTVEKKGAINLLR